MMRKDIFTWIIRHGINHRFWVLLHTYNAIWLYRSRLCHSLRLGNQHRVGHTLCIGSILLLNLIMVRMVYHCIRLMQLRKGCSAYPSRLPTLTLNIHTKLQYIDRSRFQPEVVVSRSPAQIVSSNSFFLTNCLTSPYRCINVSYYPP